MKQFTHALFVQRAFAFVRFAIVGVFATLVMLYAGASTAWAADSASVGDFALTYTEATATDVPAVGTDYSYSGTTLTITTSTPITIRMADGTDATSNVIVLNNGADVTLNGVTISASGAAAITIASGATVTITLATDSTNTVTGASGYAGIATTAQR